MRVQNKGSLETIPEPMGIAIDDSTVNQSMQLNFLTDQ